MVDTISPNAVESDVSQPTDPAFKVKSIESGDVTIEQSIEPTKIGVPVPSPENKGRGVAFQAQTSYIVSDDGDVDDIPDFDADSEGQIPQIPFHVDEDSPAAAALLANSRIRVTRMQKFARRINAHSIRRLAKRAFLRRPSGSIRGKPPRVPPIDSTGVDQKGDEGGMYPVAEHDEDDAENMGSSLASEETEDGASVESSEVISWAPTKETDLGQGGSVSFSGVDTDIETDGNQSNMAGDKVEPVGAATGAATAASELWEEAKRILGQDVPEPFGGTSAVPSAPLPAAGTPGPVVLKSKIPSEVKWDEMPEKGAQKSKPKYVDPHHTILPDRRWRIRKRKKIDPDARRKSYVKGKVIDGEHELYALSIAVMLGLRTSIGATNNKILADEKKGQPWLENDDFMSVEKYIFRPSGGEKTPPHQLSHTFKFKDYSPLAFAYIRRLFGVNEYDFLLSVCGEANFIEFISNAKSGQFFFYSHDGKYMIKTMTNAESRFLRRILPHYFKHCCNNPNTLLPRFFGMYRVKMYHLRRNVKFVIMNSVFDTDKLLQSFFDLKGSTTGRGAKPGQDVLKDNDVRKGLPDSSFCLPPEVRSRVREQLVSDCNLLKRMKIMDYSMLIGVHHTPYKAAPQNWGGVSMTGLSFRDAGHVRAERKTHSRSVSAPNLSLKLGQEEKWAAHGVFQQERASSFARQQRRSSGGSAKMNAAATKIGDPDCASQERAGHPRQQRRSSGGSARIHTAAKNISDPDNDAKNDEIEKFDSDEKDKAEPSSSEAPSSWDRKKNALVATVRVANHTPRRENFSRSTSLKQSSHSAASATHSDTVPASEPGKNANKGVASGASHGTGRVLAPSSRLVPRPLPSAPNADSQSEAGAKKDAESGASRSGLLSPSKKSYVSKDSIGNPEIGGDVSLSSFGTFDHFFEEDDGYSYLEGARNMGKQNDNNAFHNMSVEATPSTTGGPIQHDEVEQKKLRAVERMYWPFHRWYDVHGRRRMKPVPTQYIAQGGERKKPNIAMPDFVLPLSNRKDAGLTMDMTGLTPPLKYVSPSGVTQLYEGKIFYMGLIDVLQQFNIRKRLEARYRRMAGSGWADASCVHPNLYADRFIEFFDEYSQRLPPKQDDKVVKDDDSADSENVEEVDFTKDEGSIEPLF